MELEFLDGEESPKAEVAPEAKVEAPVAPEPVAEAPTEPTAEAEKPTPHRGPDGKFAKKEADEPVMVPLKALHETRDEVKALKAQLESLRQPQPEVPDMFADPEGYQAHQRSELQNAILNERLNLSEEIASQQYGEDAIEQAKQWGMQAFQANPALYQSFISQRNPYGFLVAEHRRQSMLSQLGSDPKQIEAFLAWQQAQQAPAAAPAAPTQPVERPTGSIASAPSAGGVQHIATGPGVAFDNVIK